MRRRSTVKRAGNKQGGVRFTRELRAWGVLWDVPGLESLVTVVPNGRLRTTLARYIVKARTIELGPGFFRLRGHRSAVICHEAAHAAILFRFGHVEEPHGPIWASLVAAAGYPAKSTWAVQRRRVATGRPDVRKSRKPRVYEHRCEVCHFRRLAGRPVRVWRCPECSAAGLPGLLTVTSTEWAMEVR